MPVPVSKINDLFSQKRTQILGFLDSLVRRYETERADSPAHLILDNLNRAGIQDHFRHDSGFGVELGHSFSEQAGAALLIDLGSDPFDSALPISKDIGAFRDILGGVIGLGIGVLLKEVEENLSGRVKILFAANPAKHKTAMGEKLFSNLSLLYGCNLTTSVAPGMIGIKTGAIFPAISRFTILLTHGDSHTECTMPQLIQAASSLAVALRQVSSRRIDPLTPVSILVSSITSGADQSLTNPFVRIDGTFKTMDDSLNGEITSVIESTIERIRGREGVDTQFSEEQDCAVIYDDPGASQVLLSAATEVIGASRVRMLQYQRNTLDALSKYYESIAGTVLHLGVKDLAAILGQDAKSYADVLEPTVEAGVKVMSAVLSQPLLSE